MDIPKKVFIVEDSMVIRHMLEHIINSDPRLKVVGSAESGEEALRLLPELAPDVISMDIRLPGINGFETTQRIMTEFPTPIVVISASVEAEELNISMNALRAGALTVLEKPVGLSHQDYELLAGKICTQLYIMSNVKVVRQRISRRLPVSPHSTAGARKPGRAGTYRALGIASSTGGPNALVQLLGGLSPEFPMPILLVQHITPSFLDGFVVWLDGICPLPVVRASEGVVPEPGHVYVAPPDRHLELRKGRLRLTGGDPVSAQQPSATVLFEAMAEDLGGAALSVVLTGMGDDGARGSRKIVDMGGYVIGEDETTAVVFGMPAAARDAGGICELLPLGKIPGRLIELAGNQSLHP